MKRYYQGELTGLDEGDGEEGSSQEEEQEAEEKGARGGRASSEEQQANGAGDPEGECRVSQKASGA